MAERIEMNSASLRNAFPEEYKELFSRCAIVASAAMSFHWVGEYAMMYGNPAILQKIPLRVYIGLEPADKWSVEDYRCFGPTHQQVEDFEFPDAIRQKFLKFLPVEMEKIYGASAPAYKIRSFSELVPGVGCNLAGAYSAALATALLLDAETVDLQDIQGWPQIPTNELKKDEKFNQIRRLSWKFETIFYDDRGSGAGAMLALLNCDSPFLYFTEKRSGTYSAHPLTKLPHNLEGHYEIIDKISYWGFGLEELFEMRSPAIWPIDFGLIFTGTVKQTDAKIRALQEIKDNLGTLSNFVSSEFARYLGKEKNLPKFYEFYVGADKEVIWHELMGLFSLISLQALQAFKTMFASSREEQGMRELLDSMNHFQHLTHILKVSPRYVDEIVSLIQNKAANFTEEGIALKTTGAGAGGDLVFACPYGALIDQMPKIIEGVKESTGRNIVLHYASWIDGIGHKGVLIEQHLGKKIYSEFVSRESVYLTIIEKGKRESQLLSFEHFAELKDSFDIMFDLPNELIFVQGVELTSKDIRSASATIEIFLELLKDVGKSVPATAFPRSTYSTSRNDFQSKIVLPLQHFLEKKTKKKLPLSITGSLDKFFVKFDPTDLTLAIVEKVF